jgi:hypothetical protein
MNRKIIVAVVLIIGALMTYLSRLPLAFERGANWIWSYIPAGDAQAWVLFNFFSLCSLAPLIFIGYFYLRGNVKWTFHLAALAHFITTFFLYYDYLPRYAEDVITFVLFPVMIASAASIMGAIVYFVERKTAAR